MKPSETLESRHSREWWFFSRLKNELFYGRDWRGVGYEEFRERLAAYLTHYNETRIKKSLDWMSPVQYRRSLGLAA